MTANKELHEQIRSMININYDVHIANRIENNIHEQEQVY